MFESGHSLADETLNCSLLSYDLRISGTLNSSSCTSTAEIM